MKTNAAFFLALGLTVFGGAVKAQDPADCTKVAQSVSLSVADKPTNVISIVVSALKSKPACACEIVRAAIQAAEADVKTVGKIVEAAVKEVPQQSAAISECAIAANPEAREEVVAALHRALEDAPKASSNTEHGDVSSDKQPVEPKAAKASGKAPVGKTIVGKAPLAPVVEEESPDFGGQAASIGGVYLVYPGGGRVVTETEVVTKVVRIVKRPRGTDVTTASGSPSK